MNMRCPLCVAGLIREKFLGMVIDRCGSCKGTWVGADALRAIAETPVPAPNAALTQETLSQQFKGVPDKDRQRVLKCPSCTVPLYAHNYDYGSGIIIDTCPKCHGIWLDAKELEKIEIYEQSNIEEEQEHLAEWKNQASFVEVSVQREMSEAFRQGVRQSAQSFVHPIATIERAITTIRRLKNN